MILTYTGRHVDPFNLRPEDISIRDIAHALSMTCRWGGHVKRFYSVAEHSVLLTYFAQTGEARGPSNLTRPEVLKLQQYLLLHDASEAYLTDVPSPYKARPEFAGFVELEAKVQRRIEDHFGIETTAEIETIAKKLDTGILGNEALQLLGPEHFTLHPKLPMPLPDGWSRLITVPAPPWGWTPEQAKANFLAQYTKLFQPTSQ